MKATRRHIVAQRKIQEFDLTPNPRILPMLGEIDLAQWKCLAELVDNAIDGFLMMAKGGSPPESPEVLIQVPMTDDRNAKVRVMDNGPGMTAETLECAVKAGWSGHDSIGHLGMYGMGFNIATARLGTVTTVWTSRRGDRERVGLRIDFDKMREMRSFKAVTLYDAKADPNQHGTEVIIEKVKPEQRQWFAKSGNRTKLHKELAQAYSAMLRSDGQPISVRLKFNGQILEGRRHCIWSEERVVQTSRGTVRPFQEIRVELGTRPFCETCWRWVSAGESVCPVCGDAGRVITRQRSIHGWLGLQRYLGENDYGIDFLRNGRTIERANKELFSWRPEEDESAELEYPIDDPRHRGRIVGEIHLDHCRVHYTKDHFERNDPAWQEMVHVVRGKGPMRPERAQNMGCPVNETPLSRLYQSFRRSSPKSMDTPGWKRLLSVPDNNQAMDFARRFEAGEPAFQNDEKWFELADEADQEALLGGRKRRKRKKDSVGNPGEDDADDVPPGFADSRPPSSATPAPNSNNPGHPSSESQREPSDTSIKALTRIYVSECSGQKWDVLAFRVESDRLGKDPWDLQPSPNGQHHFYVNERHRVFASATMTPRDALLYELASSAKDYLKDRPRGITCATLLSELRERYASDTMLDSSLLTQQARQRLSEIAATLSRNVELRDAQVLFNDLPIDDQAAIQRSMALRGIANPQVEIETGRFLEHAPARIVVEFFVRHPELFLDGKCWDEPYANLNYQHAGAIELARTRITQRYHGLLTDALWLVEQEPRDIPQAHRLRLLRAMYALELLTPTNSDGDAG